MSLILAPNGLPGTKTRETLSKEEIDLVTKFEAWATRRGLVFDLICRHCLDEGHERASRCQGNNTRDSQTYRISCAHCDRVYGA